MTLYLGFVILSALLLWAVIYARGPWALKLALIVTVPAYGVFVWHSIEQWKGYPARSNPPPAALVAQLIDEPTAIYLWLVEPGDTEPRAYRIPYTRQAHEELARAARLQAGGGYIGVRRRAGRVETYELPPALPRKETP